MIVEAIWMGCAALGGAASTARSGRQGAIKAIKSAIIVSLALTAFTVAMWWLGSCMVAGGDRRSQPSCCPYKARAVQEGLGRMMYCPSLTIGA
jgi:hypothetical protein